MSDATFVPDLRMTVPARGDSLALVRHVVRGLRDAYAVPADRMDDIVLAVSEAAANVAVHAYGTRPGTITLLARVDGELLRVLVRDHGGGIAPADRTPRPGHGLSLMRHVSSSMEIVAGASGTDVELAFALAHDLDDEAPGGGCPAS